MSLLATIGREAARIVLCSPCVVCGKELPWMARHGSCCNRCWQDLPRIRQGKCSRCAAVWPGPGTNSGYLCLDCNEAGEELEWIDAWGSYDRGLDQVLQAFKFARHHFLAGPLASLLLETWTERATKIDTVVAVPMHRKRMRARGFNQAALLAQQFARLCGIPVDRRLLTKIEERLPQSGLPRRDRLVNVRGSFHARSCAGRSVLLIDDICTTGATLRACATELRRQGADRVAALVIARA